jgi:purine-nucleoside phosphorylase
MGSGMGMPTLSIYLNELFTDFGVTTVIRVGTCGALREGIELGDIILPMTSSTNSHVNKLRFGGMDYAPAADFELLRGAYDFARSRTDRVHVGSIFSSDTFYNDDPDWWRPWSEFGSLACEMETNALYTLAAKFGGRALSVLTVSDSIVTGEEATAEQRERGYPLMAEIALAVAP